ncbi:hypothetical protein BC831DRAFT_474976 [Entophlyctis helioformis]|nr:hypothetical protein BC831DRAFT_474976 [Entophlyctis helioformis]
MATPKAEPTPLSRSVNGNPGQNNGAYGSGGAATGGGNNTSKPAGPVGNPSPAVAAVNKLLQSQRGGNPAGLSVVVEGAANVANRDNETFVTQRGGKIIQGAINANPNDSSTMFENRRTLQSTLLLQKKKEMQAVQAQLEKKRVEFAKRMEECREKQEELRAKQKQIRDRVAKFEKFLKENDAKRQRANAKAGSEKKLREAKEVELGVLQRQLQEEQAKSASVFRMIKKHQIYEKYLQSIVDILPPDYLDVNEPHINDIIMRHKTLVETNEDLKAVVQRNQDDIEKQQGILAGLIKEKNDLILVYNSKLGTQQKYLDKLKQDCAYLEQRLEERDNTGKERMRILSETKLAIDDLYDRISTRSRVKHTSSADAGGGGGPGDQGGIVLGTGTGVGLIGSGLGGAGGAGAGPGTAGAGGIIMLGAYKDEKTWAEKLHALQYRVLDLQDISQFTDGDRKRQGQPLSLVPAQAAIPLAQ